MSVVRLPKTLSLLANCWEQAENQLQSLVEQKYYDLEEEIITIIFHRELSYLLRQASERKEFEKAFLLDLEMQFPKVRSPRALSEISANLLSDVSLHNRRREGITGGDFGITITRPRITQWDLSSNRKKLSIDSCYKRGILCQAKMKGRNGRWRKLTNKQRDVFPERMHCLALFLYSYSDLERRSLDQFRWKQCKGYTKKDVESWLSNDTFLCTQNSRDIIVGLGNATIGTDDRDTIRSFISLRSKPEFRIRICWPRDKRPPQHVEILIKQPVKDPVVNRVLR